MNTQVEQKIKDLIITLKREVEDCNRWLKTYHYNYDESRAEVYTEKDILERMIKELNELITND